MERERRFYPLRSRIARKMYALIGRYGQKKSRKKGMTNRRCPMYSSMGEELHLSRCLLCRSNGFFSNSAHRRDTPSRAVFVIRRLVVRPNDKQVHELSGPRNWGSASGRCQVWRSVGKIGSGPALQDARILGEMYTIRPRVLMCDPVQWMY